jgi:outer membrane protein assembly factor BamB
VDISRGVVSWIQKANGFDGVDGDDALLYGSESNGAVLAWRRTDGTLVWMTDRLRHRRLTAPLLLGRSVVFGDDGGEVHFLSREDGSPLNRLTTDSSGVSVSPVVAADTLVVVSRAGYVYGFRPD